MTESVWGEAAPDALDRALDQVQTFQARLAKDYDAVEVWWRRSSRKGHAVSLAGLRSLDEGPIDEVSLRAYRGGRRRAVRLASEDVEEWARALARTRPKAAAAAPRPVAARRPPPMTYDPALERLLARRDHLTRLAEALRDNTLHEAERLTGLVQLSGSVQYCRQWTIAVSGDSAVSRLTGHMRVEAQLNGLFGDEIRQVHAPESLLPLALLGARTWRMMPRELVRPGQLRIPEGRAVLHPRALEALLRAALPPILATRTDWVHGSRVASSAISLIDDPGLDGMLSSRAFDDEGQPTRRRALIIRGRYTDGLHDGYGAPGEGTVVVDGEGGRSAALASVLMERGAIDFHELIDAAPVTVLVQSLGPIEVTPAGAFAAPIQWGQSLERGRFSRLLAPGKWWLRGRLFDGPDGPGCLATAEVSRELVDTATGVLPYCMLADVI
ncbi:MAG: hypothetical protein H6702_02810 [Myxococcales bacterium]|nr:hypothetical protein [Myxococcales bacterium]